MLPRLRNAGKKEETTCRFCDSTMPDWKEAITQPPKVAASVTMGVTYEVRGPPGGAEVYVCPRVG